MKPGEISHGFQLSDVKAVPALNIQVFQFLHLQTGAKYVHVASEDINNCFAIVLPTIPSDSSGVAHVLEHLVLCGSEKYPADSQSARIISSGFKTFINAITTSAWTMYVFASQSLPGYYHLADMYLDAVFNPLLRESDFLKQCCRVEQHAGKDRGDGPQYNGIVYNEMLGMFSNPASLAQAALHGALCPRGGDRSPGT